MDELIAFFLALRGQGGAHGDAGALASYQADFRRRFDLMSLQRNLKALGTFGYQTTTRQNPVYIQYMPRTHPPRAAKPPAVPALRPAPGTAGDLHRRVARGRSALE